MLHDRRGCEYRVCGNIHTYTREHMNITEYTRGRLCLPSGCDLVTQCSADFYTNLVFMREICVNSHIPLRSMNMIPNTNITDKNIIFRYTYIEQVEQKKALEVKIDIKY